MSARAKDLGDRILRAIAALDAKVDADARGSLARWLDTLTAWNANIDLTAARSEDELVDLMLADALILAARVPESAAVVDVGAGAGAPGLGLSLVRRDLAVTLVEPMQKRVAFLRTAAASALPKGAALPSVVRGRGEDVALGGSTFDVAISRATLAPAAWLALGAELAPGGSVWVLLAKEPAPELEGATIGDDLRYRWPLTGAERRAVRYAIAPQGRSAK